MANDYFQFKQFLVRQGRVAFNVGTDGVLLGAWTMVEKAGTILDVGTGSGLIALMLAQRTALCKGGNGIPIVALEIDEASFGQAVVNVRESPWPDRIELVHQSFQEYSAHRQDRFDVIVSNPPFFTDSCKPEKRDRNISRHDTLLGMGDLAAGVGKILATEGRFNVILPVEESIRLEQFCRDAGLHLGRICRVRPTVGSPVKRHLMEFRREAAASVRESEIAIEGDRRHDYTDAYRELTREFYLAF
jgi:tRNA1Val (adenine37-N6)-methyltransferase